MSSPAAIRMTEALPEYAADMLCPHCGGETETSFGFATGYNINISDMTTSIKPAHVGCVYSYCKTCGKIVSKSEVKE